MCGNGILASICVQGTNFSFFSPFFFHHVCLRAIAAVMQGGNYPWVFSFSLSSRSSFSPHARPPPFHLHNSSSRKGHPAHTQFIYICNESINLLDITKYMHTDILSPCHQKSTTQDTITSSKASTCLVAASLAVLVVNQLIWAFQRVYLQCLFFYWCLCGE